MGKNWFYSNLFYIFAPCEYPYIELPIEKPNYTTIKTEITLKLKGQQDKIGNLIMGIRQIIKTEDSVTVITDQGHSATREQTPYWSDSSNNEKVDEAIEEALSKDD